MVKVLSSTVSLSEVISILIQSLSVDFTIVGRYVTFASPNSTDVIGNDGGIHLWF